MVKYSNDPNRNREKNKNLSGLYAVTNDFAYKNGKLRPEVYGYVTKDVPYICKPGNKDGKPPKYKNDMTGNAVPMVLKNRMLAFWSDSGNKGRKTCWLAEKSLYNEMVGAVSQKGKNGGAKKGKRP